MFHIVVVNLERKGCLRAGEFVEFTSAVLLRLYRLSYLSVLSAQRENSLRKGVCAAAYECPLSRVTGDDAL